MPMGWFLMTFFVGWVWAQARAQQVTPAPRFDDGVAAIFRARCVKCHGPSKDSGGLRLDSYDAVMRGGERGPVVVPGNPDASLLLQKVRRRDQPPMPPQKPISALEVGTIRAWIKSGASP
jgi:hypothetical protein